MMEVALDRYLPGRNAMLVKESYVNYRCASCLRVKSFSFLTSIPFCSAILTTYHAFSISVLKSITHLPVWLYKAIITLFSFVCSTTLTHKMSCHLVFFLNIQKKERDILVSSISHLKENANKDNAKSIIPKPTNTANKYRVSCLIKIQSIENSATINNVAQILAIVFLRGCLTMKLSTYSISGFLSGASFASPKKKL